MASKLEDIRRRISILREVRNLEIDKLNQIDLKEKDRYWEQNAVIWKIERQIRELEEEERKYLYGRKR